MTSKEKLKKSYLTSCYTYKAIRAYLTITSFKHSPEGHNIILNVLLCHRECIVSIYIQGKSK